MMPALPIILFTEHPTASVPPSWGEGCVPLLGAILRAGQMIASELEQEKSLSLEWYCLAAKES